MTDPFAYCPCGHLWMWHDVDERRGDGSETCCADGCDQSGCPGKVRRGFVVGPDDDSSLALDGPSELSSPILEAVKMSRAAFGWAPPLWLERALIREAWVAAVGHGCWVKRRRNRYSSKGRSRG